MTVNLPEFEANHSHSSPTEIKNEQTDCNLPHSCHCTLSWCSQGELNLLTFTGHVEGLKAKVTADVGSLSKQLPAAVIEFCREYQMPVGVKDNVHIVCEVFAVFSV